MAKEDWRQVAPEALAVQTAELFAQSKAAYLAYKATPEYNAYLAAKAAFEEQMQEDYAEHLPSGMELKFGYGFGKLSVAIGPRKGKAKAKAPTQGLGEWLETQATGGHAS